MFDLFRGRMAIKYIFFEMLPTFFMGAFIFIFVILMFQSLRLTEYVIVHGADASMILRILMFISVSFLPVILPMSLLFAVLLTYSRMSSDSEITALKAVGLNTSHIATPAIILGLFTVFLSAQTSFFLAPWGNRKMEILVHRLGQMKPTAAIREGVFSDLFDKVIYANKVDSKAGLLDKVFIYDESSNPFTVIAKRGELIQKSDITGQSAFLKLYDGNIHRSNNKVYTKVDFDVYTINLFDPIEMSQKIKTPLSYNLTDLNEVLAKKDLKPKDRVRYAIEFHRRWALSFACLIFALLGVGLGTVKNSRAARSNSFVLCVAIVISYWITYAGFESMAKSGILPVILAMWIPNVVFTGASIFTLEKSA